MMKKQEVRPFFTAVRFLSKSIKQTWLRKKKKELEERVKSKCVAFLKLISSFLNILPEIFYPLLYTYTRIYEYA